MIVNNIKSSIGTQNNVELHSNNLNAANILKQISETGQADRSLPIETRQEIQSAVDLAMKQLGQERPSKDRLAKTFDTVKGVGGIAALIAQFLSFF
jgi:hypothetical protein